MEKQNFWIKGTQVGLFFSFLFVLCFAWYYVRGGNTELLKLHNNLFDLSFFGWSGMNITSFILGFVQVFVWGYIVVTLWRLSEVFLKK